MKFDFTIKGIFDEALKSTFDQLRVKVEFVDLFAGEGDVGLSRVTENKKKCSEGGRYDKYELYRIVLLGIDCFSIFEEYCNGYPYTLVVNDTSEDLNIVLKNMKEELRCVEEAYAVAEKGGCKSAGQIAAEHERMAFLKAQLEDVALFCHDDEAVARDVGDVVDRINRAFSDAPLHLLLRAYAAVLDRYCLCLSCALDYEAKVRDDVSAIQCMFMSYESAYIDANKRRWESDVSLFYGGTDGLKKYHDVCNTILKANPVFRFQSSCTCSDELYKWMYHNPDCSWDCLGSFIEWRWKRERIESCLNVPESERCEKSYFGNDECREKALGIVGELDKLPTDKYCKGMLMAMGVMKLKNEGLIKLRSDGTIVMKPLWDEIRKSYDGKLPKYETVNKYISEMAGNHLDVYALENVDVAELDAKMKECVDAMRYVEANMFKGAERISVANMTASARC